MTQSVPTPTSETGVMPLLVRVAPVVDLTDDQLLELCGLNRELRIKRTSEGDLLIMPPTGGGERGARTRNSPCPLGFGPGSTPRASCSTAMPVSCFPAARCALPMSRGSAGPVGRRSLPRSVRNSAPLCPDFAVELRSPWDWLPDLQAKMREYIENGEQLGWLIDPVQKNVYVYQAGASSAETLHDPAAISGDPVLPRFVPELARIWS